MTNFSFSELLGVTPDFMVMILAAVVILLLIAMIITILQLKSMRDKYNIFMSGAGGRSLEKTLLKRLEQVDTLLANEIQIKNQLNIIQERFDHTYQKTGLVKYNAFNEMGGKLSFSLCLLDRDENGFIISSMHSREGCYMYIKEVIEGNPVLLLSEEESEALEIALNDK